MVDRIIRIKIDPSDANRGIRQIDGNMQQLGGTTNRLQTQLTRVAQAVAAAFSVRQIVAYADAYTNIQNRLRVVTDGTEQLARVTGELLVVANATRANYETTATLFSTLARSTEELAISEERLIGITRTINQSFAVAGATAQEASNAIRQLSQGLASGALRGDEFNSVAEQAPGILRAVAAETGKTIGELREFAANGEITSELLIRSIENYADVVEREYAKTNRTFEQSATIARNNAIAFVGSSELIQEATAAAGGTLVTLSNNLETVGEVLAFVAAIIAGRWVGALSASALALVAQTRAALAAKVTTDSLGVAIGRTTVIANTGTLAMRGLTASLALLGGPLGLILIAASAFLIFSGNAETTRRETEKLISVNDLLAQSYEGLTAAQAANARFQIEQQIKALREQQEELRKAQNLTKGLTQDELAAAVAFTGAAASTEELGNASSATQSKIDTLDQQIEKLNGRLLELPESGKKASDRLGRLGDDLNALRAVSSGIDKLFTGEFNLFGDDTSQDDQTAARINQRIAGLKLETETIGSELELQRQVRLGFISQEQADLDFQTQQLVNNAINERDLILAEKSITDAQKLEAEMAFQEQLTAIDEQYAERRITVAQLENNTRIGLAQDFANSAISIISAFGSKSFQAQKNAAIATGIVNIAGGVAKALNNPYPANLGFAAQVAAQGAALIGTIRSTNLNSGGGSTGSFGGGASAALPTTPESAPLVGSFEIAGLSELQRQLDDLDPDEVLPVSFTRRLVASLNSVQRLEGGE